MNKFGIVLGAAAVVTLSGCKDPDYKYANASSSQNEVKHAGVVEARPAVANEVVAKPIVAEPIPAPAVISNPVAPKDDFTVYTVQSGDYLTKISKKFNVTISSIKRLNPSIKNDTIRIGQKLKLPGHHDVQSAPAAKSSAASAPAKRSAKKSAASYAGATKEYVVKGGDTLGSVAYGNGITIRQLKTLNGLTSDSLKVGQKLKIPAEKVVAEKKASVAPAKKAPAEAAVAKPTEAAAPAVVEEKNVASAEAAVAPAAAEEVPAAAPAEPAAPATTTYVVQEGDDITGVSIRWGVSAAQIRELNNLAEGDQLVRGQIIKLPAEAKQ